MKNNYALVPLIGREIQKRKVGGLVKSLFRGFLLSKKDTPSLEIIPYEDSYEEIIEGEFTEVHDLKETLYTKVPELIENLGSLARDLTEEGIEYVGERKKCGGNYSNGSANWLIEDKDVYETLLGESVEDSSLIEVSIDSYNPKDVSLIGFRNYTTNHVKTISPAKLAERIYLGEKNGRDLIQKCLVPLVSLRNSLQKRIQEEPSLDAKRCQKIQNL